MSDPSGYGQFALRLDRYARTYLLRDPSIPASQRAPLAEPAFLFLSDREGGFPANSFWLEQPDGTLKEMRDVTFVDMMIDERDLVPRAIDGLEQIYAHELGHLIMAALAGPTPRRASNAIHFVTVRTDAWTAITEGWGEHFQPMGLDFSSDARLRASRGLVVPELERRWYGRFAREQAEGCVICPANLRFLRWQGHGEQRMRDAPVRANHFIHQVGLPPSLMGEDRPAFEARMYRDVMPPGPGGALENASQMMASEGVIATLFYRLASDERLKNAYREAAFYEAFLQPDQVAELHRLGPQAVVSAAENIYLKMFDVMHRSFTWGNWPAIAFVSAYAKQFPGEASAVYDVFLDVTRGVTVDRAAHTRHVEPGYLAGLRDRLLAGEITIDAAQARPLWMVSPGMTFGMGIFRYFAVPSPFTFDLNAADVADLRSVSHVSAPVAEAIVLARESRRAFSSVDDLASVNGMTPDLLAQFRTMSRRMEERLAKPRTGGGDADWFSRLMVPLLRGSYYAAGAWQFGLALALGGTAFGLTGWVIGLLLPASRFGLPVSGRRWWRHAVRGFSLGVLAAIVPCLASVALYAWDVMPTPGNMTGLGVFLGTLVALGLLATRRLNMGNRLGIARVVLATTAASAVMGMMY